MNKTGFGFLRLPRLVETDETSIDFSVVDQMVDRFLELGGVYFDTAYTYLGGASEKGIGRALTSRYPRAERQADRRCTAYPHSHRFHHHPERCCR